MLQKMVFTNSIKQSPSRTDSNGRAFEEIFRLLLNPKAAELSNWNPSLSAGSCQYSYTLVM